MNRDHRHRANRRMTVLVWGATLLAVLPLVAILAHVVAEGASALSPTILIRMPAPAGDRGGGIANSVAGTLLLLGMAAMMALPIGIGAGLFLAERAGTRFAAVVRFLADVLSGLPSIVLGIVAWEVIVRPTGQFSAIAGSVALGLLIIPLVARATEEMLLLVPGALTESALALGFAQWRTSLTVGLRTAMPGVVTAVLVAIARAAGETAPLLFTAFGNAFWSVNPTRPIAALPLQIFVDAQSPYADARDHAWVGALILILLVTVMSLIARAVLRARTTRVRTSRPRAGVENG